MGKLQGEEREKRRYAKDQCSAYAGGKFWWWFALDGPENLRTIIEEGMVNDLHCLRSSDDWLVCDQCDTQKKELQTFVVGLEAAKSGKDLAEQNLAILQATLTSKTKERDDWRAKIPGLQQKRDEQWAQWEPLKKRCDDDVAWYLYLLKDYMKKEIPKKYDKSCEKE